MSTRIIAVTSGKGGVGKTNVSANLAFALAQEGCRTCLFDADLGLANINILLGLDPEYMLEDVISGQKNPADILIKDVNGIDIIPGSSGVEKIANLDKEQVQRMTELFSALTEEYNMLIFDTAAGVSSPVIAICMAAYEVLVVITSEPTSMTDAYALLKLLFINRFEGVVRIVVNQCKSIHHAKKIYQTFRKTVQTYLNMKISLVGIILEDPKVVASVKQQEPFLLRYPDSNAAKCIQHLAKTLLGHESEDMDIHHMLLFWQKCLDRIKNPLAIKKPQQAISGQNENPSKIEILENIAQGREALDAVQPSEYNERDHADKKSISISGEIKDVKSIKGKDEFYNGDERSRQIHQQVVLTEIPTLMNKLVKGVMTVSEELHQIKRCLENGQSGIPTRPTTPVEVLRYSKFNKAYIINYEAFLKRYESR